MAPAEPLRKQSLPFLDDNLDILVSLLGDGECDVDVDSDFESVFEMWGSEEQSHSVVVKCSQSECASLVTYQQPLCSEVAVVCSVLKTSSSVFKSPSPSKQALYRQSAISRWLMKRERRVFVKKVPSTTASSNKVVPNRSCSNGRFVKSTRGFISITEAQPSVSVSCDE